MSEDRCLRVAVVDDEPLARQGVIARLAGRAGIAVVAEYGDGAAALAGLAGSRPDLLFVDVQMPRLSGLALLEALPPAQRPVAVLLTAYDNFALRAFELQVVDYLLKPIDEQRFEDALERACRAVGHRRLEVGLGGKPAYATRFELRVGRSLRFVEAAEVDWIEADADYAALHVGANTLLLREPLHRLAERLDPAVFARVHRSTIVRLDRIAEIHPLSNRDALLRLHDGTPLRASRSHVPQLMTLLREGR